MKKVVGRKEKFGSSNTKGGTFFLEGNIVCISMADRFCVFYFIACMFGFLLQFYRL